jgi:hypothetical protein
MKKFLFYKTLALALCMLAFSCDKKTEEIVYKPTYTPAPVDSTALTPLPTTWKKAVHLMKNFPTGIQVYLNNSNINSKKALLYAIVLDPKLIELKPTLSATNKKTSAFYDAEPGLKYAAINGGFFGTNATYSLSMYKDVVDGINIKSLTRTYNGANATYYPTRAAFGLTADNTPNVTWIYHTGTGNGIVYSYPNPAANKLNSAPLAQPTATFPTGGVIWNATTAIGGSPMLIKNSAINISDAEELIEIDNTSSRARTAIGYTANNRVIIVAAEGNNANGAAGLTLAELADIMKNMGCVGAINLDGGGSTAMYINGMHTVKPSDAAGERAVVTALVIKGK